MCTWSLCWLAQFPWRRNTTIHYVTKILTDSKHVCSVKFCKSHNSILLFSCSVKNVFQFITALDRKDQVKSQRVLSRYFLLKIVLCSIFNVEIITITKKIYEFLMKRHHPREKIYKCTERNVFLTLRSHLQWFWTLLIFLNRYYKFRQAEKIKNFKIQMKLNLQWWKFVNLYRFESSLANSLIHCDHVERNKGHFEKEC